MKERNDRKFRMRPSRGRALRGLGVLAVGVACLTSWRTQDGVSQDIEATRDALGKWVETRRLISQERRDWQLGREMLDERIELVQREIDSLQERTREAESSIAKADERRAELIEENERLKEASVSLRQGVASLETRMKDLLGRLPDPIRDRVKPLSQRIPDDPETTELSLGERFQNLVGILNEANKFNRDITTTSEVRTLSSGKVAEVTAVYVGLGHAFYVTGDGLSAGVGKGTEEGWAWTSADGSAAAIARAVAILKNEDVAGFVQLPVDVD